MATRVRFDFESSNLALEANFRGRASAAQRAVQYVNRQRGPRHYQRVHDATPIDTGRTRRLLRFEFTENQFGYRLGWVEQDFLDEGVYPYIRVILYGSRTQQGFDFLSEIAEQEARDYRADVKAEIARSQRGRR